jgi:hypothetical protein
MAAKLCKEQYPKADIVAMDGDGNGGHGRNRYFIMVTQPRK